VTSCFASCVSSAARASAVCLPLIGACLALGAVTTSCKRAALPPAPATEMQKNVTSSVEPSDPTRVLALATTHGDGEADRWVAREEAAAIKLSSKPQSWTTLGSAWVRMARESSDPGYYLNADACAEMALRASPGDPAALDLRAMVLLNQHRFDEARALSERLVALATDDSIAYGTLSDALLELGRIDASASAAQAMMDLKPNAASYSRAAHLRWILGDGAGAARVMRRAIDATAPGRRAEPRAWVLADSAMLFWHRGDYDGADAGFDLALASMAEYPPALVGKARVRLAAGDAAGAAGWLERAYAKSPLAETAWLLGDAHALAGDDALARAAYDLVEREGRRTDPRTLSLFESTKGRDPADALELAERERTTRDDPYTEDAYAWALYRNARLAEARRASDAATRWGTPDARLIYHAGAIRVAEGDVAGGRRLIERALALNPKFDVTAVPEARRLLGRPDGSP
jgi:tetratricopeptide (TPR) repeat protein